MRFLSFIFIFLLVSKVAAQEDITATDISFHQNALYASAGTFLIYFAGGVYYERILIEKDRTALFFKTGISPFVSWGSEGFTFSAGSTNLIGKNKSKLELGLGLALMYDKGSYDIAISNYNFDPNAYPGYTKPTKREYLDLFPIAVVGYRLVSSTGFTFRSGLGFPEGIYLSMGKSF